MTMPFRFRQIAVFVLIALFLSGYCGVSSAQLTNKDLPDREGVKVGIGDLRLHGAFKLGEELETNIFLRPSDRKTDGISLINPSVGFELPLRNNMISADYDAGIFLYNQYSSQNHADHRMRALAEFNLSRFKIKVSEIGRIYTDRSADEISNRIKRGTNDLRAGIEGQFEKFGFDVGFSNKFDGYDSQVSIIRTLIYKDKNRFTNAIDATLSYRFRPKTLALVENDTGYLDYYHSPDVPNSFYNETLIGIRGEWFHRMNLNFKIGLRYQAYESSDIISDKRYIGPVFRGGFDYSVTDDDLIVFTLKRANYESTYQYINYYDANLVGLDYRHNFNDKIYGTLFGSYQLNLYPGETIENGETAKRYDNYLGGGASLRYDIRKWLSAEARYEYKQRICKFDVFDYVDHVVTIRGTAGF